MRVGIVGAGLAGLAAARTVAEGGHQVVLFDKEDAPGGRLVTTKIGPYTFDTGATSVCPRGQALERVILHELSVTDLVKIDRPVMAHDGFRPVAGGLTATNTPRYCYRQGLSELAHLLAGDLEFRGATPVECVEASPSGTYSLDGNEFDAVVVTAPLPLAEPLLAKLREGRRFGNARFRSCLSVLLGFDKPFEANYHALVGPDQSHPLSWLSIEHLKSPGRAPAGHAAIVAQTSAEYSRRRFEADDTLVIEETLGDLTRLLGKEFAVPVVAAVERFRYSHPETTASFESVNSPMSRLVIAGDGLLGGRTELAYETGIRAGKLLAGNV